MPEVDPIRSAGALDRSVANRKDHPLAGPQRHHLGPRLEARALFGEDEFPSGEILPRAGEQDRHLEWKHVLAVDVLVQAVEVPRLIAEEQRRRAELSGRMAASEERAV